MIAPAAKQFPRATPKFICVLLFIEDCSMRLEQIRALPFDLCDPFLDALFLMPVRGSPNLSLTPLMLEAILVVADRR
jgi:hypothetical protein